MKRNRPSPVAFARRARRTAFTLIELLVVISIIALLISILLPSLQRVRKQARAVGCRANLHQWGILYAAYAAENDGYLPPWDAGWKPDPADSWWAPWRWRGGAPHAPEYVEPGTPESSPFTAVKDILCCPMARNAAYPRVNQESLNGGTFLAWARWHPEPAPWWYWCSSYSTNHQAHSWRNDTSDTADYWQVMWMTDAVKNAAAVPVFLDSMSPEVYMDDDKSPPPQCDAIPTRRLGSSGDSACINRHDGGINSLFLDWSVRKVGLKELWTLKWHTQYNTQGPWTKAGGAKPEDWPPWLRRFKDY